MRNFTKGLLIGSVACGSVLSASMLLNSDSAKRSAIRNGKKAMRTAEDLLNM